MLYEYVRGSHLYGLHNEDSDVDTGGVFICSSRELLCAVPAPVGTNIYQPQVSDSRHDHTWFEIGEFTRLALKSNPSVLEALFVPEKCIIGKVDPLMRWVLDERDRFLSKDVLTTMYGYAKEQISLKKLHLSSCTFEIKDENTAKNNISAGGKCVKAYSINDLKNNGTFEDKQGSCDKNKNVYIYKYNNGNYDEIKAFVPDDACQVK